MERAKEILKKLSVAEKASLLSLHVLERTDLSGLNINQISLADGPSGIRKMRPKHEADLPLTCYPSVSTYACSWDKSLLRKLGKYLGVEAQTEGVNVLLGPGCNIKRSPLGGRNFEYYSEDPVLTADLATAYIKGLQEEGLGACIKHFVANDQETRRMTINTIVDKRSLHEIYFKAFKKPVTEAKPMMVMAAYNRINGEYGAENTMTLKNTLREEWGYDGAVVTDCFGAHSLPKAIKNGLNVQMAAGTSERMFEQIEQYMKQGQLSEADLDKAVVKCVELSIKCTENSKLVTYHPDEHRAFAREVAEESIVLLKNEEMFFPLKTNDSVVVIGGMASELRYQGGGSSHVDVTNVEQVYDNVKRICPKAVYAFGYKDDYTTGEWVEEAIQKAILADKVVLCLGLPEIYESEGYDREHMRLPECQVELLNKIAEVNKNIAVVLFHGSPVEMPWLEKPKAILDAYLPGEAGGAAVANIIFGKVNPCGKLAETIPQKLSDTPSYLFFPGGINTVRYAEGIYVGYRYYDKKELEVAFPFGHGLSYTTFEYRNLHVSLDDQRTHITFEIINTGLWSGKEVVQIYIRKPGVYHDCPVRELVAFDKVSLHAGEKKKIDLAFYNTEYSVYDEDADGWIQESGNYMIEVGSSSREILLSKEVRLGLKGLLPQITADTPMGDMIDIFDKKELLKELLTEYPVCEQNLKICEEENPMIKAMATAMGFCNLLRSDNDLKEEQIMKLLERLNE